jgi:hypothetical protein
MLAQVNPPRLSEPGINELGGLALVVFGLMTFVWCFLLARRAWETWSEDDQADAEQPGK